MDKPAQVAEIAILSYDGAQAAAVLGLTDLLAAAARIAAAKPGEIGTPPRLRVSHWTRVAGQEAPTRIFSSAPGIATNSTPANPPESPPVSPPGSSTDIPTVIVIPPGLGDPLPQAEARFYAAWLRAGHARGAGLCSICKGAYVLAETGLLAGRTVTIHWTDEAHFTARFPDIRVDADRLIIDDGDIVTAGGVMAWIDLGLILIERFLGAAVMQDTARAFLVDPPGREQSDDSAFSPRLNHGDAAILRVQHWLGASHGRETRLDAMADRAGLDPRTFIRRFKAATGHTTGDYVQRLRVEAARDLLLSSRDPVDAIAWQVHYSDPGAFRKIFTRVTGLTPTAYRQRFRTRTTPPG